jgi:hypothetical protein
MRRKLSDKDVDEIRILLRNGWRPIELSKLFKVDATLISHIKDGRAYRNVATRTDQVVLAT